MITYLDGNFMPWHDNILECCTKTGKHVTMHIRKEFKTDCYGTIVLHKHNSRVVKNNRVWRSKRHLKKLYVASVVIKYICYNDTIYEIYYKPLRSD